MTARESAAGLRPLDAWLHEHGEGLIAIRRNLHAHPELSGEEHATTELVRERLELAGLAPRRLSSGTGLICDLPATATTGARFALRADLDGLAMDDDKDVHYRSQVPGVSHACGHDVHTAVMLGTALYYAHHLDEVPGPLRFIFQPAEERVPGGALDVLADGGLDDVEAIVGVHCEPKAAVGVTGLKPGPISSAADMATITISGPGGHTARPEMTVDMIALAARLVQELPRRVAAALDDPSEVKIVFGALNAGDAANVIPTQCLLRASIRTPSVDVWEQLPTLVEREISDLVAEGGAVHHTDYVHGVPPVVNDGRLTEIVRRAATREFGAETVVPAVQSWGGDDFAWFTRQIPGTYIRLGRPRPRQHRPAARSPRRPLRRRRAGHRQWRTAHGGHRGRVLRRRAPRGGGRRMSGGLWVFGYGSLVSPASMARTLDRPVEIDDGWQIARLVGFGRRWNKGSLRLRGTWHHAGRRVDDGIPISLGVVEADGESCNGVAVRLRADEIASLDWRERDYVRTDVTDRITGAAGTIEGTVVTYVPREAAVARYEDARDTGRGAVRRDYWDLVHAAFAELGPDHLDQLTATTPAPDVPIADITIVRD